MVYAVFFQYRLTYVFAHFRCLYSKIYAIFFSDSFLSFGVYPLLVFRILFYAQFALQPSAFQYAWISLRTKRITKRISRVKNPEYVFAG